MNASPSVGSADSGARPRTPGAADVAVAFSLATRFGAAHLTLRPQVVLPARLPDCVRAALLLDVAEPLVQLLEDWLGQPLDPEPALEHSAPVGAAQARWRPANGQVDIALPWALLLAHRPAGELLARLEQALAWQATPVQLVLSRQLLSDGEWRELHKPGASMLLPESFSGVGQPWPCELKLPWPGGALRSRAQWQPGAASLQWQVADIGHAPASEAGQAVVQLCQPLQLTPPALLAWQGETRHGCDAAQPVCLVREGGGDAGLKGRLFPVGLRAPQPDELLPAKLNSGYLFRADFQ